VTVIVAYWVIAVEQLVLSSGTLTDQTFLLINL